MPGWPVLHRGGFPMCVLSVRPATPDLLHGTGAPCSPPPTPAQDWGSVLPLPAQAWGSVLPLQGQEFPARFTVSGWEALASGGDQKPGLRYRRVAGADG